MISVDEAKRLKSGISVMVSSNKQVWTVDHVEMKGIMPIVHVWRMNEKEERQESLIVTERLHLFELVEAQAKPIIKPEPTPVEEPAFEELRQNLQDALNDTVESAVVDVTITNTLVEDKFTQEPKLTKPARKTKKKSE